MITSPRTLARTAGLLYLASSALFIFAETVRSGVIAPGNPAATAHNLRASATLFRVGFVSDLVSGTLLLLAAMALYLLLRHVHPAAAGAMVVFAAILVVVGYLNLLNQYTALAIATGALGQTGSDAQVMLFATMQRNGQAMDELFWGLWLLPLGYLVIRSAYFPRVLGVLLIVGCVSWVLDFFVTFLAPDLTRIASLLAAGAIGELVFMLWLVVKAVRIPAPEASVPTAAHRLQA